MERLGMDMDMDMDICILLPSTLKYAEPTSPIVSFEEDNVVGINQTNCSNQSIITIGEGNILIRFFRMDG